MCMCMHMHMYMAMQNLKCGIEKRSPIIGFPEIPLPSAIGSFISFLLNLSSEIISFRKTFSLLAFGISIPIVFFQVL